MMPLQNTRSASVLLSTAPATNADATGSVDTLGFHEAAIVVQLGPQAATGSTTSVPTTLKLQESDDDVASNYADITGFKGGTNDSFKVTAISLGTDAALILRANLDLRKRKRFLRAFFRPQTLTQPIAVTAVLGKAGDSTKARASGMAVVKDG